MQGVACKTCQPLPPNEREVGRGHLTEALQRRNAAVRIEAFTCPMCSQQRPREEFWPGDFKNRFAKNYALGCKICKPIPPNERKAVRIEALTCPMCSQQRLRAEFWPGDFKNRFVKNYVLGCKMCKPIPPNERKARKSSGQAASSSAGNTQ